MTPEHLAIVERIADQASTHVARRAWWMNAEDLRQEAWAAALRAGLGKEFEDASHCEAFMRVVISRKLSAFCGREARRSILFPLAGPRVQVETQTPERDAIKRQAALLIPELRAKLETRLRRMTKVRGAVLAGAIRVLLDGQRSGEVASKLRVPSGSIARTTKSLRARAKADQYTILLMRHLRDARQDLED